jgi:excisionase family DNA binding protein
MPSNTADFGVDLGNIKAKLDSALVGVRIAEKMASDAVLALEHLASQRQLYAAFNAAPSQPIPVHGERLCCRVREAAEILGVSERTIWRLINDGTLETIQQGRSRLIRIESLNRLAAGKVPA